MVPKVAMVADHAWPGEKIDGGVQAVTNYLVNALALTSDVELHVIRFRSGINRATVFEGSGFFLHSIPMARWGTITGYQKDLSTLNEHLSLLQPDVVHSQGGGHYGIVAKRARRRSVVTIHGILTQEIQYQVGIRRQIRSRLQAWMSDYYCIRRASHTILISPYVADYYRSALSGKRYLIANPVDPRFFAVARREVPGRVLFAGRLNRRKGVKDLLRAVARVAESADIHLVLAGSTAEQHYVKELKAEIGRLRLTELVDFRGTVATEELLEELSKCTCLVLPSYQETAPMVVQEAMASGVPVIASDICGIPYQVEDGNTGFLIRPGDVDSLAERLVEVLSNRALRERLGAAAKVRAEVEYHASAVARQTLGVYQDMLR